ncbi:dual specificity protein phosphatase 22-B isoform X2 [Xiphias gladius]|uniref:dual specificity protein phosphatase 22-B isoform X2 n=1 Tax=Xiphias gladius TaxID=8245 RepID=UPI001A9872E6|nr:dual specificity protein phosphatase 22-B isoform X2 [Xiphias gladius]
MGNGIDKVLPDLYLGNFKGAYARDREQLARNNITHILSIHDSAAPILQMTYLCISAADLPTQNLIQHFKQSIMFMHESRLKGEGCLVHCLAGVSRSVTLVVAYIMTVTGLGWQEALAAVRAVRPCAGPNLGFQRQLQEFEATQADEFREWLRREYEDNLFNDEADIRDLLDRATKVPGEEVKKPASTPPGGV